MLIVNVLFFIIACFVLVKASNHLMDAILKVAAFFHATEFSAGFVILALCTSMPELFIGILSAVNGVPLLALGNVIGSNVVDLTLVIGIVALLAKGIKIEAKTIKKDLVYMLMVMSVPVVLAIDHKLWHLIGLFPNMVQGLSWIDGVILLCVFAYYVYSMVGQEHSFHKEYEKTSKRELLKSLVIVAASVVLLMVSAEFVVRYATLIAGEMHVSSILMGLFVVAVGTSLPDLMMETKAVLHKHDNLAVGNMVGAIVANSTLVLGVIAIISPIEGNFLVFMISIAFMMLIGFIFLTFAESNSELSWKEGMSLVMLYVFFIIVETYIKSL